MKKIVLLLISFMSPGSNLTFAMNDFPVIDIAKLRYETGIQYPQLMHF